MVEIRQTPWFACRGATVFTSIGAHDVVLDGINVSFALVGYQIESDDEAEVTATNNVLRNADIGYVTDGVSAAAANVSVIGMNIHDAGTTKSQARRLRIQGWPHRFQFDIFTNLGRTGALQSCV